MQISVGTLSILYLPTHLPPRYILAIVIHSLTDGRCLCRSVGKCAVKLAADNLIGVVAFSVMLESLVYLVDLLHESRAVVDEVEQLGAVHLKQHAGELAGSLAVA